MALKAGLLFAAETGYHVPGKPKTLRKGPLLCPYIMLSLTL
jgi:hypothetical protein